MKTVLIICATVIASVNCGLLKDILNKKDEQSNNDPLTKLTNALDDGTEQIVVAVTNALDVNLKKEEKPAEVPPQTKIELTTISSNSPSTTIDQETITKKEISDEPGEKQDKGIDEDKIKITKPPVDTSNGTTPENVTEAVTKPTPAVTKCDEENKCIPFSSEEVKRNFIKGDECPTGLYKADDNTCQQAV